MQFADRPGRFDHPGQCAILPGRMHDDNGGVQLDGVYDGVQGDIRLWLSYAGLQKIVAQFGDRLNMATKEELDDLRAAFITLQAQHDQEVARANAAEAKLARINGVAKDGFKIQRQQGRMPAKAGK